jgi:hypothetical protein
MFIKHHDSVYGILVVASKQDLDIRYKIYRYKIYD